MVKLGISSFGIFLYLIVPTYLLSGGYSFYNFVYMLPIGIYLISIISLKKNRLSLVWPFKNWNIFFMILLMYSTFYMIFSGGEKSIYETMHIFLGIIIFTLTISFINDGKRFERLIVIIKLTMLIVIIHSLINFLFDMRITASYSNENRLASFLVLFMPFILSEILARKKTFSNVLMVLLVFVVLLLSDARFNQLGFIVQLAIFIYFFIRNLKIKKIGYLLPIILMILIVVIPFQFFKVTQDQYGRNIIEQYTNQYSSMNERTVMIENGFNQFTKNLLLGVGPDQIDTGTNYENFHNFFIQLMASYGLIPIIGFIILYFNLFLHYKKLKSDNTSIYSYALILFLLSFPLICLAPSYIFDFRPFYMVFAVFISLIYINLSKKLD
ncbi:O-antigen ligase family protein [Oceanobacillus sp. FSL K6-0127]|uniref:O-antigen ligase family protein n=1 Tax=Oceanobacillus sp. FSL K6-0127 TaxID=2921420 RepID=UPI0030EE70E3